MAGQLWSKNEDGGFYYTDELSNYLRMELLPDCKMRQFCDGKDGRKKGLRRGSKFSWNIHDRLGKRGSKLEETKPIPETGFKTRQDSLEVTEYGIGVPFTEKLDNFSKYEVIEIIDKVLKVDAKETIDTEVYLEFKKTPLRIVPVGGNNVKSIQLTEDGTCSQTNDIALGKKHIGSIVTLMKERKIPTFVNDSYVCITNPSNLDNLRDELEQIYMHTDTGIAHIYRGEVGKYREMRFVEQTFIVKGGAQDSTTFDPLNEVEDAWDNDKSSWAIFTGADTVIECLVIAEQIRGQIGQDYGRQKGVAWYGLFGYGLTRKTAKDATCLWWDSAA